MEGSGQSSGLRVDQGFGQGLAQDAGQVLSDPKSDTGYDGGHGKDSTNLRDVIGVNPWTKDEMQTLRDCRGGDPQVPFDIIARVRLKDHI